MRTIESDSDSKVRILIHCPQCGGDIDFLEEAQVIHCQFCGSSLLVAGREGALRYVIPAQIRNAPEAQSQALEYLRGLGRHSPRPGEAFLFYVPFWRMQGTVYRWVFGMKPMKVESTCGLPPPMERMKVLLTRRMDHSIPGYAGLQVGLSTLGIRTQVLRVLTLNREPLEQREFFLPLEIPLERVQEETERYSQLFFEGDEVVPEVVLHRIVGKIFSVVYFPIWWVEGHHREGQESVLIDAVGKSALSSKIDRPSLLAKLAAPEDRQSFEFNEVRFLPFRCPNCGWEFSFQSLSVLHFCVNCRRLWREKGGEWGEMGYGVVTPPEAQARNDLLWVPFWCWRAVLESGGEKISTMADLYRMAPPPRVIHPEREAQKPIFFYIPAVKFRNPLISQHLASRLTFIRPEMTLQAFPDGSHPLTAGGSYPQRDALDLGPIILGALIPQNNRRARTWLKGCRVDLQDPQIFYFPFAKADLFWQGLATGISFQQNALSEDLTSLK